MVFSSPGRRLAALLVLAAVLAGCGNGASPSPSPGELSRLTVGLGYIPSVQFAPFYLAQRSGFYADEGLEVVFENKIDPDLIALVGQGSLDLGLADGTSVIPAVNQEFPIRYLATIYARFPSVVFALASSGIEGPEDLAGRKLGIPGRYGSSWVMLQALLASADLTPDDLEIVEYPDFGQGAAVSQGAVDAATGFINNEPVVLGFAGASVNVLRVDEVTPLPGPGLIAGTDVLRDRPEVIRAFVAATLRGMREVAADPEAGLDATFHVVPELGGDAEQQRAILDATIATWSSPVTEAGGYGALDLDGWAESLAFMVSLGLAGEDLTVDDLVAVGFTGEDR